MSEFQQNSIFKSSSKTFSCSHHNEIIRKNENCENKENFKYNKKLITNVNTNNLQDKSQKQRLLLKEKRKPLSDINTINNGTEIKDNLKLITNREYCLESYNTKKCEKTKMKVDCLLDIPEESAEEVKYFENLDFMNNEPFSVFNNMNFITTEREYDILKMKSISLEDHSDDSFLFEDVVENNLKLDGKDKIKMKNEKPKENLKNACTPANSFIPQNHIQAIKEIRKAAWKSTNIEQEINNEETNLRMFLFKKNKYINIANCIKNNVEEYKSKENNALQSVNYDTNLTKKKTNRNISIYRTPGVVNLDPDANFASQSILYSMKYFRSIVEYQLKKEYDYKLSDTFLKKYTITNLNRSIVINWLIKLQTYLKVEHVIVYSAIRMMDRFLDAVDIPLEKLQLVALASFWISLKFHAVNHREASWMVKQTNEAYSKKQLVEMEQKVFQINNFDVNPIDFSIYIHYYILKLQLLNSDMISHCSHYILDCALLDCQFVRTLPSMMAAASVYTSLVLLHQYNDKLWFKLHLYKGFYLPKELETLKVSFIEMLKEVNNACFQCREPFYKFSSNRYYNIAKLILEILQEL